MSRLQGAIVVVKISQNDLAVLSGSSTGSQNVPSIFNTFNDIVKGINEMLDTYKQIRGIATPQHQEEFPRQNFQEARAAKKVEMSGKSKQIIDGKVEIMPDELGEILKGFIKSCGHLETLGYGNKSIGEAVLSLPFTVTQAKEFLSKMEAERKVNND